MVQRLDARELETHVKTLLFGHILQQGQVVLVSVCVLGVDIHVKR